MLRFIILASCISFISCQGHRFSFQQYQDVRSTDQGYINYYPKPNELYLNAIECREIGDSVVVVLNILNTYRETNLAFVYFDNTTPTNKINFKSEIIYGLKKQNSQTLTKSLTIEVSDVNKNTINSKKTTLNFYPKERYGERGQLSTPSALILQKYEPTEIVFIDYKPSYYIKPKPENQDVLFAQKEWGNQVANISGTLERAELLQLLIMKKLNPFQGIPSDSMNVNPFVQYQRVIQGRDQIWCTNWSDIFELAAACFDIPVRKVGMMNTLNATGNPLIVLAEGHTVLEVWDDKTLRWVLIDLTFGLIKATYQGVALNAQDLQFLLNHESYRNKIMVKEYDTTTNKINQIPLIKSREAKRYYNEYKVNQKIGYYKVQ